MKEWTKRNVAKLLAVLAVLAVGTAIIVDQVRDDKKEEVAQTGSPTPTPSTGVVSGSNDQRYEYAAAPGQGITHLARMAVTQYMKDTPNTNLIPEQRIFAEDFLKDRTLAERVKSKFLEIGEKISFEVTDVRASVNAALALTAAQIAALAKYVLLVVGF